MANNLGYAPTGRKVDLTGYVLPADTAKNYTWTPGAPLVFVDRKLGEIDIRKVTPAIADKVIAAGITYITKNAPVAAAAPAAAPAPAVKTS